MSCKRHGTRFLTSPVEPVTGVLAVHLEGCILNTHKRGEVLGPYSYRLYIQSKQFVNTSAQLYLQGTNVLTSIIAMLNRCMHKF